MNTKLYVGNLSWDATEEDLKQLFGDYGDVTDIFMPMDRESGRPRGFAFVTLGSSDSMNAAAEALNGNEWMGRAMVVNEAKPQESRDNRSGGFRSNNRGARRDDNGYGRRDDNGYGGYGRNRR